MFSYHLIRFLYSSEDYFTYKWAPSIILGRIRAVPESSSLHVWTYDWLVPQDHVAVLDFTHI